MSPSADTWGVSGPRFLLILGVAYVIALLGSSVLRRLVMRGRSAQRDLHPYEVAYLVGGRERAVAASLATLRSGAAIEAAGRGELRILGQPRMPLYPLDWAILHAISQGMNTHVRTVPLHPAVRTELDAIRARLEAEGLVASAEQRLLARLVRILPMLAVLLLGAARLLAGITGGKPVSNLVFELAVMAFITLFALGVPKITWAGKRAMLDARRRNRVLSPGMSPSWGTYGPAAAGLGVALFGAAALVSIDPQFAAASQIPQHLNLAAGSSGGSGVDSSSSCSGGDSGSSSSCSGGSSCGGGCGGGCGG